MTTETMREAVALAIKEARALPGTKPVAKISDVDRRAADAAIRTVLERLREPTSVMKEHGNLALGSAGWEDVFDDDVKSCWQAMLDAAGREVG